MYFADQSRSFSETIVVKQAAPLMKFASKASTGVFIDLGTMLLSSGSKDEPVRPGADSFKGTENNREELNKHPSENSDQKNAEMLLKPSDGLKDVLKPKEVR
jgi:hypothetical protein